MEIKRRQLGLAESQVPPGGDQYPCTVPGTWMALKSTSVRMDGDQPADGWSGRLEANPRRWLCPEEGSVGTRMNAAYTQSRFLPSALQKADV